jgi:alpha-tubulin suppressor-like RCC1 family protein
MRRCRFRASRRALFAVPAAATLLASVIAVMPAGAQITGVSFSSVVAGNANGCAEASPTALYCWGDDTYNQLLDGGNDAQPTEPNLLSLSATLGSATIASYATGNKTTCILTSTGLVYCWGYNGQGQVGDDSNVNATSPQALKFNGTPNGTMTQLVGGGDKTFCALTSATASQIWCWGGNESGQLGNDTSANSNEGNLVTNTLYSGDKISQLAGWSDTFCAVASNGEAFCWGAGDDWNLGNDSEANSNVPVQVETSELPVGVTVKEIAPSTTHTCFLDTQSNVWCWGSNINGVNGLGDPDGSTDPNSWFSVPQKVTSLDTLGVTSVVSSDVNSCALAAGALYCWGGEPVGDGNQNGSILSPELITAGDIYDRTISDVSVGDYNVCAVDSQSSLYCWGDNNYGQNGDGTTYESVTSEEIATSPSATTISTVPNSPVDLQVDPTATQLALTWQSSFDDGGSAITSYTGSATDVATDVTTTCTGAVIDNAWGCDINGLTVTDTYIVSVTATSNTGTSVPDSVGDVVLPDVPDSPTLDVVRVTFDSITATWTPGASDNGQPVEAFTVAATTISTSNECAGSASQTMCTIDFSDGIASGSTFSVTVEATNDNGNSAPSNEITAILGYPPGVPQDASGIVSTGQVAVSWSAPLADGGTPITGYVATATQGANSLTCLGGPDDTGCTITGLTNGLTYDVTLVAQNQAGNSSSVDLGNFEPTGPPTDPTLTEAKPGVAEITAAWTAPLSNGGDPLTGYTATATSGGAPVTCNAGPTVTTCLLTGLTDGTTYSVSVIASSNLGGSGSSNSLTATPGTAPSAPSAPTAALTATGSVTLTWTPPSSTGGNPISKYVIASNPASAGCSTTGALTCKVSGLIPTDEYTFTVTASNSFGNSPASPSTLTGIYPFLPKGLGEEILTEVVSKEVSFPVILGDATPGTSVSVVMDYGGTIKCTANAFRQCVVKEKQPIAGHYELQASDGKLKATLWYYEPLMTVPAGAKVNTVFDVKFNECPPGVTVSINVDGKNFSAKSTSAGLAIIAVKITKTGTYTVTATVKGTVISPTAKTKIIT